MEDPHPWFAQGGGAVGGCCAPVSTCTGAACCMASLYAATSFTTLHSGYLKIKNISQLVLGLIHTGP